MSFENAVLTAMGGLAAALLLSTCSEADAHDAPMGWSYPFACCSDFDCREVPDDWIDESGPGYRIVITGETIPQSDTRLKNSPDGKFHWCSVAGSDDGRTICLFVPPRGF